MRAARVTAEVAGVCAPSQQTGTIMHPQMVANWLESYLKMMLTRQSKGVSMFGAEPINVREVCALVQNRGGQRSWYGYAAQVTVVVEGDSEGYGPYASDIEAALAFDTANLTVKCAYVYPDFIYREV